MPMMMMVTRKVYLRPTRSPRRPNTSAPKGRTEESRGKREQREDEARCFVDGGKKLLGDDRGQRSVQIEVVPLEHGTE